VTAPKEVFSAVSAFHDIRVTDYGFSRVLSFGRNRQSSMFLDSPFDTDFEYPSYFHVALALKPDAATALAIGLGGATVVKRMWRDYPEMRVDAVELDPEVVGVARRFFALPEDERIRVFTGDGRGFLEASDDSYDLVIVDAFDDDAVPPHLSDDGFIRVLRDRVGTDGIVAYNFIGELRGEGSMPFRELYRRLADAWDYVWVFVVNEGVAAGGTNIVLFATDAPVAEPELRRRIASRVDGLVSVPAFHLFGDDLWAEEAEQAE